MTGVTRHAATALGLTDTGQIAAGMAALVGLAHLEQQAGSVRSGFGHGRGFAGNGPGGQAFEQGQVGIDGLETAAVAIAVMDVPPNASGSSVMEFERGSKWSCCGPPR